MRYRDGLHLRRECSLTIKSLCRMQTRATAQKIIEAMRIHYNYCRVHSKLKKTSAEQAGITILRLSKHDIYLECLDAVGEGNG